MTTEKSAAPSPERRAADAMPVAFAGAALKSATPLPAAFADAEVETIDIGAALPPGHDDHLDHDEAPVEVAPRYTLEQNRERMQIVKFKQTFDAFEVAEVSQITIRDIRRGDVIEIKTPLGKLYFRVVDRLRGLAADVGEILVESRYDVPGHWVFAHAASITLPVCSGQHVIVHPDGTERQASRALKMTADVELPEAIKGLLTENQFLELKVHATPEREKLRLVDIWRWLKRGSYRLKALIDENNRREQEKERLRQEKKRQKQ